MEIDKKDVITDHEMVVDGVTLRDKRELITEHRDNLKVSTLIHTRWIGGDVLQVISVSQNGVVVDTTVKSELSEQEVDVFEQTWRTKWNPQLSEEQQESLGEQATQQQAFRNLDQEEDKTLIERRESNGTHSNNM